MIIMIIITFFPECNNNLNPLKQHGKLLRTIPARNVKKKYRGISSYNKINSSQTLSKFLQYEVKYQSEKKNNEI